MFGQGDLGEMELCRRIGELKVDNKNKEGEVYIGLNQVDSSGRINVFLINRSDEVKILHGFDKVVEFGVQARNENGEWKEIDLQELGCGTGYGAFILPPNSYTWEAKEWDFFQDGEFATELRFTYIYNGQLLTSDPVPCEINTNRFLPFYLRHLSLIDEKLYAQDLSPEVEKQLMYQKSVIYLNHDHVSESIAISKALIEKYPDFIKARYKLGQGLVISIGNEEILPDVRQVRLMSKAIEELDQIPKDHEDFESARRMVEVCMKYLPTQEEWGKLSKIGCKKIGKKYYCYEELIDEWVPIMIKERKL